MIALFGCNRHQNPEVKLIDAPPSVPAGWTVAHSLDGKVSVGVPGGWRVGVDRAMNGLADLTGGDSQVQRMAESIERQDKAQEEKELAALRAKGVLLNVIDGSKPIPGEARTHYRVIVSHADWNLSLDEAFEVEKKNYFENVKPRPIKLPIGDAYVTDETRNLRDGGVLTTISYLVVDGHDTYTLRFVTESDGGALKQVAAQVAPTLRVKR